MTTSLTLSEKDIQTIVYALEDKLYQPGYICEQKERAQIEEVLQAILIQFPLVERR